MASPEYLAIVQGAITRMAGNSFLLKGWTVTLVAGLSAFAADKSDRSFALIAVAVVIVFALLDAYYLALERAYRDLYMQEAGRTKGEPTWNMDPGKVRIAGVLKALRSPATWPIHGVALIAAIVVAATA
jgi:hypothetical protein